MLAGGQSWSLNTWHVALTPTKVLSSRPPELTLPNAIAQIRRAAEAWCRAFGSNREGHLSFVRGEIRKAWDSSKGNRRRRSRRSRSEKRSSPARGSGLRGDGGSGDENRLTPSSILAPDAEKGTDVFWVQVGRSGERQ